MLSVYGGKVGRIGADVVQGALIVLSPLRSGATGIAWRGQPY